MAEDKLCTECGFELSITAKFCEELCVVDFQ